MTNKEKAIKECELNIVKISYTDKNNTVKFDHLLTLNIAKKAIDIASKPDWVSVETELPKDNRYVLVYNGYDIYICLLEKGNWYDFKGRECYQITHWMPLVEKPETK